MSAINDFMSEAGVLAAYAGGQKIHFSARTYFALPYATSWRGTHCRRAAAADVVGTRSASYGHERVLAGLHAIRRGNDGRVVRRGDTGEKSVRTGALDPKTGCREGLAQLLGEAEGTVA